MFPEFLITYFQASLGAFQWKATVLVIRNKAMYINGFPLGYYDHNTLCDNLAVIA